MNIILVNSINIILVNKDITIKILQLPILQLNNMN